MSSTVSFFQLHHFFEQVWPAIPPRVRQGQVYVRREQAPLYRSEPRSAEWASLRVHGKTHAGITRCHKPNEDAYAILVSPYQQRPLPQRSRALLLVADGMGGHTNGKFASTLVISTVRSALEEAFHDPLKNDDALKECFLDALAHANTLLYDVNMRSGTLSGTTVTGALLLEQPLADGASSPAFTAHVVNVGDSRTYVHSPSRGLLRITRDHSIVEDLVRDGVITDARRYTDFRRHTIHRCIGDEEHVKVDEYTVTLQKGDRLLVCSDGLWEMVFDEALAALLMAPNADASLLTDLLIQAALDGGGRDNVTAVVALLT